MKDCPFQNPTKTCGDWCQLFYKQGQKSCCIFQEINFMLGDISINMPEHTDN